MGGRSSDHGCITRDSGRHLSTPYYPQSNGKIERVVGTMLKRAVLEAVVAEHGEKEITNVLGVVGVGAVVPTRLISYY